jgi:hypothetical protein
VIVALFCFKRRAITSKEAAIDNNCVSLKLKPNLIFLKNIKRAKHNCPHKAFFAAAKSF